MRAARGFTLVEVMVVVAIVGILAAIAIPNFLAFQARSKQAEAKTNLRAIYTGQTSRYAEKDSYSFVTGEIAFAPERGNRYSYDLGAATLTSKTDLTFSCASMEDRSVAVPVISAQICGVMADTFRYGPSVIPTITTGRGAITFLTSLAGNTNLPPDSVGVNQAVCPTCDFAARAIGNVDNDPGVDEVFVSSQFGSGAGATCADQYNGLAPGSTMFARNDVSCQ